MNSNLFKVIKLQDEVTFNQYIQLDNKEMRLTEKGHALKEYLQQKLRNHVAMLEFNGIKPQYLGKINTMLKRFEKFWQIIFIFANRKSVNIVSQEEKTS
jgi:hypothetical protein